MFQCNCDFSPLTGKNDVTVSSLNPATKLIQHTLTVFILLLRLFSRTNEVLKKYLSYSVQMQENTDQNNFE